MGGLNPAFGCLRKWCIRHNARTTAEGQSFVFGRKGEKFLAKEEKAFGLVLFCHFDPGVNLQFFAAAACVRQRML